MTVAFIEFSQQPSDVGIISTALQVKKKNPLSPFHTIVHYLRDTLPSLGFHAL